MHEPFTAGMTCSVCGAYVDIATPLSWRCPNWSADDPHHAMRFVHGDEPVVDAIAGPDDGRTGRAVGGPYERFRRWLAWDSFAAANGMTESARAALVDELDAPLGFSLTPFARHDALSDALGFATSGGVWVKDETGQVAGSHKARHLFTILLHLRTAEVLGLTPWTTPAGRPPLAIASCGNAAIAAATLAASVEWPISVFVPPSAEDAVVDVLGSLGADIVVCPRLPTDPPGDPCVHRFREAVAAGAVPFTVQGTENVWCLDGGRTLGWEIGVAALADDVRLDRLFVQVGGGALAACAAQGLEMAGGSASLHVVQTTAGAPLVRAWTRADAAARRDPERFWEALMWPWEQVGSSAADGILDDETYDWLPVFGALQRSGGSAIEVEERQVLEALRLVREHAAIDASATGTAGLAGLLATRDLVGDDERVAIVLSGVRQEHRPGSVSRRRTAVQR